MRDLLSLTNKDAVPYLLLGVDGPPQALIPCTTDRFNCFKPHAGDAIYTSIFDEDFESFYGDDILAAVKEAMTSWLPWANLATTA